MNDRNVQALKLIFLRYISAGGSTNATKVAAHLASEGVLVPRALSDEECKDVARETMRVSFVGGDEDSYEDTDYYPEECRARLERIAKGEVA